MPILNSESIANIEALAKMICINNLNLSDLSNLSDSNEYKYIFKLFASIPKYKQYSHNSEKIYLIFHEYINENEEYLAMIDEHMQNYNNKNIESLRELAISKELIIRNMKEIPDKIHEYIIELIVIEKVNDMIKNQEFDEVLGFMQLGPSPDSNDLFVVAYQYEKKIRCLYSRYIYAKGCCLGFESKSIYLKYCEYVLNTVVKQFSTVLSEYVTEVLKSNLPNETKKVQLELKKDYFMFKKNNSCFIVSAICADIIYYIQACQLICEMSADNVEKSALLIYKKLNHIIMNYESNFDLYEILEIEEECRNVANKLFAPIITEEDITPKISCKELCRIGLAEHKNNDMILSSFFRLNNNHSSKNKNLWSGIKSSEDVKILSERYDVLSFFQNYASGVGLSALLKAKFAMQKIFIETFSPTELKMYYKLMAHEAEQVESIPHANRASVQGYYAMIMEYLAIEVSNKPLLELRKVKPNMYLS